MACTVCSGVRAETVSKKLVLLLPRPWIRITVSIPSPAVRVEISALPDLTLWIRSSGGLPGLPLGDRAERRPAVRKPEEALERDREVEVAPGPEAPRAEGVQAREAPLTELEPGLGVAADDDVGVALRRRADLAGQLVHLDRPALPEVVELDAIARLEARIGSEVALGERRKCILHSAEALMLKRCLSQGRVRVPPRTVVPAHQFFLLTGITPEYA